MSANRLSLSLYKGLLKASKRLENTVGISSSLLELNNLSLPIPLPNKPTDLRQVIRHQFNCTRNYLPGTDLDHLHDSGLKLLSFINHRATILSRSTNNDNNTTEVDVVSSSSSLLPAEEITEVEMDNTTSSMNSVKYSIGHVFRHRKYGYKAVIVGYDSECKASDSWIQHTGVANLPSGLTQPFYHCLVDVRDRPEAQVSYVAQDNVMLLSSEFESLGVQSIANTSAATAKTEKALERLVLHPLVLRYFEEYRPTEGRYIPSTALLLASPSDLPGGWQKLASNASGNASDDEDDTSSRGITTKGNN